MNKFDILNGKYNDQYCTDEESENTSQSKSTMNRQHDDLFDTEDHVIHKIIHVRRKSTPKKGEYWEILEDNKIILELKGYRFSKKEREFLRTAAGIMKIISLYKSGNSSVAKIKKGIESEIK